MHLPDFDSRIIQYFTGCQTFLMEEVYHISIRFTGSISIGFRDSHGSYLADFFTSSGSCQYRVIDHTYWQTGLVDGDITHLIIGTTSADAIIDDVQVWTDDGNPGGW